MLNKALLGQAGAWKTILSDWNPHAIVLNGAWLDSGALANRLISSRAWKMVYFDGATIILVRDLPEYETLINDPRNIRAETKVCSKRETPRVS